MSEINQTRLIEALLFASAEPMSAQDLYEHVDEDVDVGGILMALRDEYAERGVNLIEIEGKWAFRTAKDLAEELESEKHVEKKLSRAALETMSIIAYHQPVTRAEIENIRGVTTHKGTLDILMEARWIKPGRRRQTPGRPLTWVTTTSFLDHFALESIMDLPGMDDLKASGLLDRRPAIEAIPGDDLFSQVEDDDEEELEEEEFVAYEDEDSQDEELEAHAS
ncbi:MAG: SMC-Scp complex subunit ScpB [Pseudomonadota bacterium]